MATAKKRFPTKERMRAAKVYNSWHVALLTLDKLYISWSPQITGRGYQSARYQVIRIDFKTDPKAHWQDDGHKTFSVFGTPKEEVLQAAIAWADERYGKREWVRDPWGSYQDATALEAVWHEVTCFNNLDRLTAWHSRKGERE